MGYTRPIKLNPADGEATIYNYGYRPSLAMGIVGIVTFFLVMLPHLWWFIKKRGTRSFHGLMTVACVIEILGYGAVISSHKWRMHMGFLASSYLIQAATVLFTAAVYKAVTRLIKYAPDNRGRSLTPMRPRSILTLFIIFDIVMVVFQIAGVYFGAAAESADHTDDDSMLGAGMAGMLFLAGTLVQTITWIVFLGIFVCIARRTSRLMLSLNANTTIAHPRLVALTKIVYITWFLFFIRLIFRLAQAGQGQWEYAGTHEFLFAIFEFLPMLFAIGIWAALPLSGFLFPDGVHPKARGEHHMAVAPVDGTTTTTAPPSTHTSSHAGEKV